jgi:hypothetical protein
MSMSLVALAGAILAIVLVVGSGPAYKAGLPLPVAFGGLALGVLLGAVAALAGVAALVMGWRRGQPISIPVAVGLVIGLLAFAVPFQRIFAARGLPAIHDISTDVQNPPAFQAVLPLREGAPNDVTFRPDTANEQLRAYPDIRPLVLMEPADAVFARALDTARDMDWDIVAADRAAGRLEATATTRWFGFRDDVVVRLTPESSGGTRVDVRSVSRVGRGDLGTNADRIREFLGELQ